MQPVHLLAVQFLGMNITPADWLADVRNDSSIRRQMNDCSGCGFMIATCVLLLTTSRKS